MTIDRLEPTQRPPGRALMRQRWAELGFLHWEIPATALRPLVPAALELDTFDGRAFVGLVPFTITGVRPPFFPALPWISAFHEINVRTYVHLQGRDPGVWFFSLDAARLLAVIGAQVLYHLPYKHARMSLSRDGAELRHRTQRLRPGPLPAECDVRYAPIGAVAAATPGTLEHFLAERYILYSFNRERLYQGRVYHTPYPLQPARIENLDESLLAAAGITRPESVPLAHFAKEVHVEVFRLKRLS
jgi:uncharacterized protein